MDGMQNDPGALAGAHGAESGIDAKLNDSNDTATLTLAQRLLAAASLARAAWLDAADRLAGAADCSAARREIRERRLAARELARAASAAAADGGIAR